MAALHAASYSTCLRCLVRRTLSRPAGIIIISSSSSRISASVSTTTVQTRGKKTGRRGDSGVVVRLLQDVPQFGQKETVLRIDRGRMRNLWYPRGIADYVTTAGQAVSERDPFFGLTSAVDEQQQQQEQDEASRLAALQTLEASRAAELLESLPAAFVFQRRPITASTAAIFGSVSADDVAAAVRAALQAQAQAQEAADSSSEAARVRVDGRDVRFVVAEAEAESGSSDATTTSADDATADRVKALGRWEVEISVRGTGVSVPPVRKIVEVVAQ